MNGAQFWRKRVLEVICEHGLVRLVDTFTCETDEVDDRTIQQIAESMDDAHHEYTEFFTECPDCAGKGYFKPEYEKCARCDGSGRISISEEYAA